MRLYWVTLFIGGYVTVNNAELFQPIDDQQFVLTQGNIYHAMRAGMRKKEFMDQIRDSGKKPPDYHQLHERWSQVGAWSILPIVPDILKKFPTKAGVFFCEDETTINVDKLTTELGKLNYSQELFLGKVLRDREATIIHHFAYHEDPASFAYPDFAAGFLVSMPLLRSLGTRLQTPSNDADFTIDAKHELAQFIYNKGEGLSLTEAPFLCTTGESETCATSYRVKFPQCGKPIPEDDVFIAVKTCTKFHTDRIPVVQTTWLTDAKHVEIYSDTVDDVIPTISFGIPNTDTGHCAKTLAILHRAHTQPHIKAKNWLVIVDDDTLISIPRLRRLLACYDPVEPVALGERYGFGHRLQWGGYDYITGGGGIVLSHTAVQMLIDSHLCQCAKPDSPDDMTLGMCLKRLSLPITHSPLFHQARPNDYSEGYLDRQIPVSFHKHWMLDPVKTYNQWLHEETPSHEEL